MKIIFFFKKNSVHFIWKTLSSKFKNSKIFFFFSSTRHHLKQILLSNVYARFLSFSVLHPKPVALLQNLENIIPNLIWIQTWWLL